MLKIVIILIIFKLIYIILNHFYIKLYQNIYYFNIIYIILFKIKTKNIKIWDFYTIFQII